MLGAETPDLTTTPCPQCGELVSGDVVWDPWSGADLRVAAMPFHPTCAEALLPAAEPTEAMRLCGICGEPFAEAQLAEAFCALHARFQSAHGSLAKAEVVWRLAGRQPRVFVAEHFACLLGKV